MKKRNLLLTAISLTMLLSLVSRHSLVKDSSDYLEPDNVTYDDPLFVDFNNPVMVQRNASVKASSLTIHYHNDDGECASRELWIWCSLAEGQAHTPTVSADGKDMTVSFDFTGDFAIFAKAPDFSFIVKKVGTWDGQSENVEVNYEDYPPNEQGKAEIWAIPGEGSAVEIYKTEEETKMDRFMSATFTDWKHIEIIATDVPQTYKLYALTSNYMKISAIAANADKLLEQQLIASGSSPSCTNVVYNDLPAKKFTISLNYTIKPNVQYYLTGVFPEYASFTKTKYVSSHQLYETPRFRQYYTYKGNDLGATYEGANSTTFRVWAPTAARIRLLIYPNGTPEGLTDEEKGVIGDDTAYGYDMAYRPGGIWQVTVTNRDLDGMYYNYYVVNSLGKITATDPYAHACGVNGDRGMILDFDRTDPEGWAEISQPWDHGYDDIEAPNDLSIYETHIRDLTMDETWTGTKQRGTYPAFIEKGTTYTGKYNGNDVTVKTGFDHIEEMGVKAVQLEPVFDSDNSEEPDKRVYNWGYNPKNYNCIDGAYSTNPYDGEVRVREFKEMVLAFAKNKNKTRTIMDVVYNHVASAPGSCFNKLMPKYYFRYWEDGTYSDGSGCGNEVKTEAPMMSKYIVDSLCWWAKEFNIKGFRFDLMGLIDWQTLKKAAQELYKIDPDIYLYGEGWTGSFIQSEANIDNKTPDRPYYGNWGAKTNDVYSQLWKDGDMCYVGAFNDKGRNELKGGNDIPAGGWSSPYGFISQGKGDVGDKSSVVADMMIGYHTGSGGNPNQCINYGSCHDNFTLFDQLTYTVCADGTNDYPGSACAASTAVNCAIMFSNGVAFMQGGEELFRSKVVSDEEYAKYGDTGNVIIAGKRVSHNSYRSFDSTNSYKWDRKISVTENGSTVYVLDYVKELQKAIELRKNTPKRDYGYLQEHNPYDSGSDLNVWGQGSGNTTLGMKNGEYFFFIAGFDADPISFGAYFDSGFNVQKFCSNPKSGGFAPDSGSKTLQLGWYTCVCLSNK